MSPTTKIGDSDAGIDLGAGRGNSRCLWDESVCVDKPTHFVTFAQAHGAEAEVFCVRHYVLTLAKLCQVHLPECDGGFRGHVLHRGAI